MPRPLPSCWFASLDNTNQWDSQASESSTQKEKRKRRDRFFFFILLLSKNSGKAQFFQHFQIYHMYFPEKTVFFLKRSSVMLEQIEFMNKGGTISQYHVFYSVQTKISGEILNTSPNVLFPWRLITTSKLTKALFGPECFFIENQKRLSKNFYPIVQKWLKLVSGRNYFRSTVEKVVKLLKITSNHCAIELRSSLLRHSVGKT